MNKTIKLLVLALVLMPMVLILFACNDTKTEIKFIVNNQEYAVIEMDTKEEVKLPDNPSKGGYLFDGWYFDEGVWENQLNIDVVLSSKISQKLIVYAKWNICQYNIEYNLNGGELQKHNEVITYNQLPYELPIPTRIGYTFAGWKVNFSDYDYITQLTSDNISSYTLIATWEYIDLENVIRFEDSTYVYDGTEKTLLAINIPDYVNVFYSQNKLTNVGEIEVTATFEFNNNIFTKTAKLKVVKATHDMSNIKFNSVSYVYDGTEKPLSISGTLPDDVIVYYQNNDNVNAGTYIVIAKFINNNKNFNDIQDMQATLVITKASYDMSQVIFENKDYIYDGSQKEILISGTLPVGVTISYSNNKLTNVGSILATASFIGDTQNYYQISPKTALLIINKATYDMSGISFNDDSFVYDGSLKSIYISGVLPNGVIVSYSGNNMINAGVYEVVAAFTGDSINYKSIESKIAVLTIEKATPIITPYYNGDVTTETDIELMYNENITGTLTFDSNQTLIIGVNSYSWTFVPQNSNNYNNKKGQITIVVKAIVNFYNEDILYHRILIEKYGYVFAPQIPTKSDYQGYSFVFSHWSLKNNGEEFDFDTQVESNINVYAVYTNSEIEYTVTYHNTKDVNNTNAISFYVTTPTFTIINIEKIGYVFDGWFDDDNYTNQIEQIEKGTYRNINLYAKWTLIQYTITYHSEYSAENQNPLQYTIEDEITLQNVLYAHYNFMGWYSDDEFTTKIDKINIGTIGDKNLYAKWEFAGTYIRTYTDLLLVNNNLSGEYKLMNDIDLNGVLWTPYGDFYGYFDGNKFTISNYTVISSTAGLFSFIYGEVENIILTDVVIDSSCEKSGSLACYNYGTINNCSSFNIVIQGKDYIGGLVAYNQGIINNCCTTGEITSSYLSNKKIYIGSIVGYNDGGEIKSCYSTCVIFFSSHYEGKASLVHAGGIVGYLDGGNIQNCFSNSNVDICTESYGILVYAGGIVGLGTHGSVLNCYASGNIHSSAYSCESVYYGGWYSYAGGLIGYLGSTIVENCYAIGNVKSEGKASVMDKYHTAEIYIYAGLLAGGGGPYYENFNGCYADINQLVEAPSINNRGTIIANMETIWVFVYGNWDSSVWNLYLDKNPTLKCI